MATLIDEGLVEDCLDEVITITDLEEVPIIDLDDIDATIEDPGYILEEPLKTRKQTEEYTSSYKKGSFTLPVQFFDISRNVSLLKKCRPISVKIVDCNIYPWYYKRIKYHGIDNLEIIKDKDKDKDMLKNTLADFITFNCNDTKNEKCFSVNGSNIREIELSSKQSLAIARLKDDIKETIRNYKLDKDYNIKENTDENNAKHYDIISDRLLPKYERNINESLLNKNNDIMNPNDLLTYRTIAQNIVRNLDYGRANCGNDEVVLSSEKSKDLVCVDSYDEDVELVSVVNIDDLGRKEKPEKASERIITSPILPCTVRPKKTRKKKLSKTSTAPNTIFKICNNPRNSCHKFISTDKVIPHYHYIDPNLTPDNTNNNFISTNILNNNNNYIDNYSLSQYNITRDIYSHNVTRPKHYVNKKHPHSTEPPPYRPPRLGTYPNYVGLTSGLDYNPICNNHLLQNAPLRTTPLSVKKPNVLKKNINPNAYIPYLTPQLNYLDKFSHQGNICPEPSCPTITENQINVSNVSAVDFSKENCRLHYANSAPTFIHNSICPRNEYVSAKKLRNPMQMTVAYVQKNYPLLTNLLDSNQTSIITSTENSVIINTHTNQFPNEPSKSTPKVSNQINLDALITVLAQNNRDSFNLRNNYTRSIKKNTKPKKVKNTIPEYTTIDTNQHDTKFDNYGPSKTLQPTQQDFEANMTSEQIPRKVSSYSPPILPIPTFKKGLEILSKLQPCVPPNDIDCTTAKMCSMSDMTNSRREYNKSKNIKRKRIGNCDEKKLDCKKSRKISLQEYKQRKLENGKEETNVYVNNNDTKRTTNMQSGKTEILT